ncbi:retrovirus-related pol polyprotein from transposon TNT 1-94 [Tanacetum coccineum]
MVKLNARCSAVLQNELLPKEKDPGSYVLPCIIGNTTVSNALADLGASVSVILFSMFKRLGLGNPRPVNMVIEIADRSMQSPKGLVENVLIKIYKFIFLVNFVILDIVEDNKVPIILGRPMLANAHARIDVFGEKISLEVGKEQVIFNANEGATPITVSPPFVILNIVEDNKVPIILGRPMMATAHTRIDVFGGKISLEVGKEQVIFNANEEATLITVSPVCVIKIFDMIDDIDRPGDLEEFLMNDNRNEDLGNFLQDNNLFLNYETNSPFPDKSLREIWSPTKGLKIPTMTLALERPNSLQ